MSMEVITQVKCVTTTAQESISQKFNCDEKKNIVSPKVSNTTVKLQLMTQQGE